MMFILAGQPQDRFYQGPEIAGKFQNLGGCLHCMSACPCLIPIKAPVPPLGPSHHDLPNPLPVLAARQVEGE